MLLALFDLDHTLLATDSDVEWTEMLEQKGLIEPGRIRRFLADYHAGKLDVDAFYAYQVGALARFEPGRLDELRRECFEQRLSGKLAEHAVELVAAHRARGHVVALITATNRFLVEPLAQALGFEHLIATEPERENGRFTGRILPPPCLGAGKIVQLERWLERRGQQWTDVRESWFYSDSSNDLPLLEKVHHALVVGGDERLLARARERGWPCLAAARPRAPDRAG